MMEISFISSTGLIFDCDLVESVGCCFNCGCIVIGVNFGWYDEGNIIIDLLSFSFFLSFIFTFSPEVGGNVGCVIGEWGGGGGDVWFDWCLTLLMKIGEDSDSDDDDDEVDEVEDDNCNVDVVIVLESTDCFDWNEFLENDIITLGCWFCVADVNILFWGTIWFNGTKWESVVLYFA